MVQNPTGNAAGKRLVALTAAANAATAAWGMLSLYAIYTPLLRAEAPGFKAVIALSWYHIEVLGKTINVPALDRMATLLFPVVAASVYAVIAAAASSALLAASLAGRHGAEKGQLITPVYIAAVVAVASTGPLLAARRLVHATLQGLVKGWYGITNAGEIELYKPEPQPLLADQLLAGFFSPATTLAVAAAALAAVAALESMAPSPVERPHDKPWRPAHTA